MKLFDMIEPDWSEWVSTRPENVQMLCRQFPPNNIYRIKSTGQQVTIYSYSENDTLTVDIDITLNPAALMSLRVFGIKPEDLEEV